MNKILQKHKYAKTLHTFGYNMKLRFGSTWKSQQPDEKMSPGALLLFPSPASHRSAPSPRLLGPRWPLPQRDSVSLRGRPVLGELCAQLGDPGEDFTTCPSRLLLS